MVESLKFLGTTISRDLKWEKNTISIIKKAQQRMFFLRQLKKFNLPQTLMIQFYTAIIESILTASITIWFGSSTSQERTKLQRIISTAERIIGCNLPSLQQIYTSRVRSELRKIKTRRAAGPDGISSRLLKSCNNEFGRAGHIFNLTLDEDPGETASCPPPPPGESSNGPTSICLINLASEWRTPSSTFYTDLSLIWRMLGALFAGCNLTAQSLETLCATLETENSSLRELDLSNSDLQDSGLEKLSAGLKSSRCKLVMLRLAECKLSYQSCDVLGEVLQTETSCLKELDLGDNKLQDAGVEKLSVGLISSHCKLERLRLSICNFTAESCKSLTSALQTKICFLKELDLCGNELQDSIGELLFAGLKTGDCKLEILRLALCNLEDKMCESLESLLKLENSSLKELDLSNNDVQNSGVELLSAGLTSLHCKLEKLRLSGCMITEKGFSSLASALSSNPSHLKELDLTYNHPEESGGKLLSAGLEDPHCSLSTLSVEHGGENRIKPGLKKYSCEVTLDPNTAQRYVCLSDGNRKVERVGNQSYPDHPERFDGYAQVLSRESLTGRCYWEAEWSGKEVYIAVTYKSISRKGDSGDCGFGWNVKSWRLECTDNSYSVRHNKISTAVSVPPSDCKRVGVYVDCPAGTLSFYRVSSDPHTLTHLHTVYTTFTEPLYAGFTVCSSNSSVCVRE
ncbi:hypothetical protein NFI96_001962 [Prochilodus magdalenae]|nr:hypothetical protein NFI96_001962 [Prochilodus magdalenae]